MIFTRCAGLLLCPLLVIPASIAQQPAARVRPPRQPSAAEKVHQAIKKRVPSADVNVLSVNPHVMILHGTVESKKDLAVLVDLAKREVGPGIVNALRVRGDTEGKDKAIADLGELPWETAEKMWNEGELVKAAQWYLWVVKEQRKGPRAGEAAYKCGAALLLAGQKQQAKAIFDVLVKHNIQSPWAKLVLLSHYDKKQTLEIVQWFRQQMRSFPQEKLREHFATAAMTVLQLYHHRFAPQAEEKKKMAYLLGDCCQYAPAVKRGYRLVMEELLKSDSEGQWGKLARLHLGDQKTFVKHMDELISMSGPDKEHRILFLALADKYEKSLTGTNHNKCRFYRARCCDDKQRKLALLAKLVQDHPHSQWASEAVFWIAEHYYCERQFDKAKKAYAELLKKYAKCPRAGQAKRYLQWLKQSDKTEQALTKALGRVLEQVTRDKLSLAFTMDGMAAKKKNVHVRVAWQGTEQFYCKVQYGQAGFLFAQNDQGMWYRSLAGGPVQRTRKPFRLPLPDLTVNVDPATGNINYQGNLSASPERDRPKFQIAATAVPAIAQAVMAEVHVNLRTLTTKTGGKIQVFHLEGPGWDPQKTFHAEVEVSDEELVREIRMHDANNKAMGSTVRIHSVVLGNPLPASMFSVRVPANVPVREVEQINPLTLFSQVMELYGEISQDVQTKIEQH